MNRFLSRWLLQASATFVLVAAVSAAAIASTIVYDNSSTGLGAGSIGHMSPNGADPILTALEVGDIVTLEPSAPGTKDRQLERIRIGYFVSGGTPEDDRFRADFIFNIYPVDGAGEIVPTPIFTRVFEDRLWFDGSFAINFDFDQTPTGTLILPETFAYTYALGTRTDDPNTAGDGLATSLSFNSRGPVTVGSSPPGLVRLQTTAPFLPPTFNTTVFGSGRETRITITAGPVTIPEPTTAALVGLGIAAAGVGRRRYG